MGCNNLVREWSHEHNNYLFDIIPLEGALVVRMSDVTWINLISEVE